MRRLLGPVRFCSYLALAGVLCRAPLKGATQSILFARGYKVIPLPQKIAFRGGDFEIGDGWRLELGKGVKSGDVVKFSQELAARNRYAAAHGLAARTGKFDWTDYEHCGADEQERRIPWIHRLDGDMGPTRRKNAHD